MISIPNACAQPWAAMTPTAAGRHCGACQTEVVDFTRLSEAEVLAYLTARKGQPVCAYAHFTQLAPAPISRWRRWLLAGLALLGWQPLASCVAPQQPPPGRAAAAGPTAGSASVVVRGVVLDDSLRVPVAGAYVFVEGTKYGAVTDEQGEFVLSFSADWEAVKSGFLKLHIPYVPFTFLAQDVKVIITGSAPLAPVTVRLRSIPERGFLKGKAVLIDPPVPLPGPGKTRP
ncbi:carboxypeptidase-like regulatory domain-containing protein [Hymenobacter sp.]|uniref:carboxypeptidase-like regulatory domain-containing protein n=1 Tax=Hymenobacter sp. TaxID=1898978 RepID=UPI00286D5967|nr:carboxypeptidase-like regulatory domain-containing protein [Hymenobacter sp.]